MPDPLSIVSTVLQIIGLVRRTDGAKRALKVTVYHGFPVYGMPDEASIGDLHVFLEAVNDGARPVTVEAAGLVLGNGEFMYPPMMQLHVFFPRRLAEGDKHIVWLQLTDIVKAIREKPERGLPTHGWCRDTAGRTYKVRIPRYVRETIRAHLK